MLKHGLLRYARNDAGKFRIHVSHQREDVTPHSRGMMCPRLAKTSALAKEEGAGKTGCTLHPRSRVQTCTKKRTRAYRFSGGIRPSLRNGFTAYFALSPVNGLSCHRRPANIFAKLDASVGASGPHDFAVRERLRSSFANSASTASHRAFRDVRNALSSGETGRASSPDLPDGESKIFFARGLDRFF
jgi:hypothetical protein